MRHGTLVILLGLTVAALAAPNAVDGHPLAEYVPACTAKPGLVHEATRGVTAGRVRITCTGSWHLFQGIQWYSGDPTSRGRWSYGGTRYVNGKGDTTLAPWTRPYHGTGWWRQVVKIDGQTFTGPVSWLDA